MTATLKTYKSKLPPPITNKREPSQLVNTNQMNWVALPVSSSTSLTPNQALLPKPSPSPDRIFTGASIAISLTTPFFDVGGSTLAFTIPPGSGYWDGDVRIEAQGDILSEKVGISAGIGLETGPVWLQLYGEPEGGRLLDYLNSGTDAIVSSAGIKRKGVTGTVTMVTVLRDDQIIYYMYFVTFGTGVSTGGLGPFDGSVQEAPTFKYLDKPNKWKNMRDNKGNQMPGWSDTVFYYSLPKGGPWYPTNPYKLDKW